MLLHLPTRRAASLPVDDFYVHDHKPPFTPSVWKTRCEITSPTSTMSSSNPTSLLDLPTEMDLLILQHLSFFDLHSLRLTNHYFHALIPPPTHAELLDNEQSPFACKNGLSACVGWTRLRPKASFSPKMFKMENRPGQPDARNRFCIECGRRPLPGPNRYLLARAGRRMAELLSGASNVRRLLRAQRIRLLNDVYRAIISYWNV